MVIVIVHTCHMVGDVFGVVMIVRAALKFRMDVFKYHVAKPTPILDVQLCAEHEIFQLVEIETAVFLHIVFLSGSIAVIVEMEQGRMVFKEMIGIKPQRP